MALIDLSAESLDDENLVVALPAAAAGQAVKLPRRCRMFQFSNRTLAVYVAFGNLDGTTLTDSNSLVYAAGNTHDQHVPGCSPGREAVSRLADTANGIVVTFAGSAAGNLGLILRS